MLSLYNVIDRSDNLKELWNEVTIEYKERIKAEMSS